MMQSVSDRRGEAEKISDGRYSLMDGIEHLYDWQHGGTSFSSHLFTMFQKADPDNYARLSKGFPIHATAHDLWKNAPSQTEFFEMYGLGDVE